MGKMLTPTNLKNIKNFKSLKTNTQRVFKHRLIKKCSSSLKDIEYILLNREKLNIKVDKIIDISQLVNLLDLYEKLSLLQNM